MDPTLRNRTISALKAEIGTLSPRLRSVAKYIVDHPSDFGLDTIRETARKCSVSTYTLVRIAKRMGFDTFEEMREPFRQALVTKASLDTPPDWVASLQSEGSLGKVQADAALNAAAIVERSLEQQSPAQLQRVATMLLDARHVYVTAVRASYSLAYYFHYVGRMALPSLQLIPRHMNSAIDELNYAGPGDVMIVFTFAPYSREIIEAAEFARRKGVKLIFVADSEVISPNFTAEETLIAATLSTHHFGCYTGAMALVECLLALLVHLGGSPAETRIKSYETLRKENNAYWIGHKKH
ncbi:MAG: MurR/RpiR family transcriptional regulator [Pseudomonadota bacterium]